MPWKMLWDKIKDHPQLASFALYVGGVGSGVAGTLWLHNHTNLFRSMVPSNLVSMDQIESSTRLIDENKRLRSELDASEARLVDLRSEVARVFSLLPNDDQANVATSTTFPIEVRVSTKKSRTMFDGRVRIDLEQGPLATIKVRVGESKPIEIPLWRELDMRRAKIDIEGKSYLFDVVECSRDSDRHFNESGWARLSISAIE